MKRFALTFPLWLAIIIMLQCFGTTNYYTGRVLAPGQKVITPAWNNLFYYYQEGQSNKFRLMVLPGVGAFVGLPYRFEIGTRYTVPFVIDGVIRWQINPASFRWMDASLDYQVGAIIPGFEGLVSSKYGMTFSRQTNRWEPYVSINRMVVPASFMRPFIDDVNHSSYLLYTVGIAYTNQRDDMIIPEMTVISESEDVKKTVWSIGLSLRIPLHKKKSAE